VNLSKQTYGLIKLHANPDITPLFFTAICGYAQMMVLNKSLVTFLTFKIYSQR